jgi:hypothetical protein
MTAYIWPTLLHVSSYKVDMAKGKGMYVSIWLDLATPKTSGP